MKANEFKQLWDSGIVSKEDFQEIDHIEMVQIDGGFKIKVGKYEFEFDGASLADGVGGFIDGIFGNPSQVK